MQFAVGDLVRCKWGAKLVEYEAKILELNSDTEEYYVHYQGWNKRYDEWITEKSIIGLIKKEKEVPLSDEVPKVRHSKREKKAKKPVDWSPSHNVTVRNEEKPARKKNPHHTSAKSKHSPANKCSKGSASSVSPFINDSTDDEVTSDEDVDPSNPRSYIDLLARAKKKAERKRQRGNVSHFVRSPSQVKEISRRTHPSIFSVSKKISCASTSSPVVSSTYMECHNFAPIGCDDNYSSLRFIYNKPGSTTIGRKSAYTTSSVIESLNRILPVRKPLNFPYITPRTRPAQSGAHALRPRIIEPPRRMTYRQRPIEAPPNLGSPFNYCDELHCMPTSSSLGYDSLASASSRLLHEEDSDSRTFSSSSSEPGDVSSGVPTIMPSEAVSTITLVS